MQSILCNGLKFCSKQIRKKESSNAILLTSIYKCTDFKKKSKTIKKVNNTAENQKKKQQKLTTLI